MENIKKDAITFIKEGGMINEQSMARLYITGGEWSELVEPEDVIEHFESHGFITEKSNDIPEAIIEQIAEEHPVEYLEYIRDLIVEYESTFGEFVSEFFE